MSKIKIEDIQNEVKPRGWKVLSNEYKNLNTDLIFCCPEGHKVYASWGKMRDHLECPVCKSNPYKVKDRNLLKKRNGKKCTLGLDQSTKVNGFSVYYDSELVDYGVFQTSRDDIMDRCNEVKMWVISLIEKYRPDLVALEGIQLQQNGSGGRNMGVTTFEALATIKAVLMDVCYEMGIQYVVCPTNTWRAHCQVKGKTRADKKRSMQLIVKKWFDISVTDDEADAIGIGKYAADTFCAKPKIIEWSKK